MVDSVLNRIARLGIVACLAVFLVLTSTGNLSAEAGLICDDAGSSPNQISIKQLLVVTVAMNNGSRSSNTRIETENYLIHRCRNTYDSQVSLTIPARALRLSARFSTQIASTSLTDNLGNTHLLQSSTSEIMTLLFNPQIQVVIPAFFEYNLTLFARLAPIDCIGVLSRVGWTAQLEYDRVVVVNVPTAYTIIERQNIAAIGIKHDYQILSTSFNKGQFQEFDVYFVPWKTNILDRNRYIHLLNVQSHECRIQYGSVYPSRSYVQTTRRTTIYIPREISPFRPRFLWILRFPIGHEKASVVAVDDGNGTCTRVYRDYPVLEEIDIETLTREEKNLVGSYYIDTTRNIVAVCPRLSRETFDSFEYVIQCTILRPTEAQRSGLFQYNESFTITRFYASPIFHQEWRELKIQVSPPPELDICQERCTPEGKLDVDSAGKKTMTWLYHPGESFVSCTVEVFFDIIVLKQIYYSGVFVTSIYVLVIAAILLANRIQRLGNWLDRIPGLRKWLPVFGAFLFTAYLAAIFFLRPPEILYEGLTLGILIMQFSLMLLVFYLSRGTTQENRYQS